ncbi:MAG: hypothetical protein ACXVA9_09125 [Bdellovibrionales bacterium]
MKNEGTNIQSSSANQANNQWQTPVSVEQMQADIIDTAKRFYDDFVEYAGETLGAANKRASSFIRHYPVESAAGALVVGVACGALLFRRRA